MGNNKNFNIILTGIGGQGIITLTRILSEAALINKKDVKTSELHGLSQRGGSVETHVRFGSEIYSPLVRQAGADLVISLERQESLKGAFYSSEKTIFLVNNDAKTIFGVGKPISAEKIKRGLEKFSKKVILIPATEIAKKKLGNPVLAGVYLLSFASQEKLLPLEKNVLLEAVKRIIPKKYFFQNKKVFELVEKL